MSEQPSRFDDLNPFDMSAEERNKAASEMYDILLFQELRRCVAENRQPEGNIWHKARQRFRDVGIVDASKSDDSKMSDLMKRALEAGGAVPPVSNEPDEATWDTNG